MAIQKVQATLKGITPLLMHCYPMVPIEALEKKSPEEQAEHAAYRTPEGELYIPGIAIQRALVGAATFSKGKGRATLQKPVAACVLISPERILFENHKKPEYEIDARPVVIPSTRGRVIRYRPRLNEWEITFTIEYDDTLLTETQLRRVVDDMGQRVGLLDFRPEKKGSFGRCLVVKWES